MNKPTISLISIDDALEMHDMVIAQFGGREGVLSLALLESALGHVSMVIEYGTTKEQDICYLVAIYFYHIIKNHPFIDGNKRTGLLVAIDFLFYNDYELDGDFEDVYNKLYSLAIETADSKKDKADIAAFFKTLIK